MTNELPRERCARLIALVDHCQIGTRVPCSMKPISSQTVEPSGLMWAMIWHYPITLENGADSAIWKVCAPCSRRSLVVLIETIHRSRVSNDQYVRCSFLCFVRLDSTMARNRIEHPIWLWSVVSLSLSTANVTVSSSSCGNHLREGWITCLSVPWSKGSVENDAFSSTWPGRSWSVVWTSLLEMKLYLSIRWGTMVVG